MTTLSLPNRYQVRALLGEGGSGRVHRAFDSIRDRDVALKLVTPAESEWLRREFDTLRQIRHENLIQVFEWGSLSSGEAYYTMELIEGGDWARLMGRPQSADDVRRILTGVLRGLAHLHCHGEIHGDLKPGNILLGAGDVVKITDAGMGGSEGAAAGLSGTPGYAAPEVWEGAKADVRSDLYSVGVMAYEALTGRHPFAGRTVREVVSGQLEGWVPSPAVHSVKVPADLERVVMRAVERQPVLRQGSADESMEGMGVEDRIGEILGGKLVGRENEIAEIETLLYSEEPGTPTLVHVVGEPGIGKTALLEEVAHRHSMRGGRTLTEIPGAARSDPGYPAMDTARGRETGSEAPLSAAVQALCEMSAIAPILICVTRDAKFGRSEEQRYREVARFAWALSLERSNPTRVLVAIEHDEYSPTHQSFELIIRLQPFDLNRVLEQALGMLGTAEIADTLVQKLTDLTGGNPGAVQTGIADLIDRELITRRGPTWVFREIEKIATLTLPAASGPWTRVWEHSYALEREALLPMALLPRGIPSGVTQALGLAKDALATAEARGLIRNSHERWLLTADSFRQVILSRAPETEQRYAAAKLMSLESGLEFEERVDLVLRFQPSASVQGQGMEAARLAVERGDYRTAVRRLRQCLGVARSSADLGPVTQVSLRLAEALHQSGEYQEALSVLTDSTIWEEHELDDTAAITREHLLGKVHRSLGDLDSARVHFRRAIERSHDTQADGSILWSHIELAELDWRHGGEAQKEESINRLRLLAERSSAASAQPDAMAALMYQLGAALFSSGKASAARQVLLRGTALQASPYWRMRLVTALGSVCNWLGLADDALRWADEAWRYAENSGFDGHKARILSNRGAAHYRRGLFREALDQDLLSAMWGRRLGSLFEYAAGCAGASINQIVLARYEDALVQASNALDAAEQLGDARYVAKACELRGLALYYLGEYGDSELFARRGLEVLMSQANDEVQTRLDWLMARVLMVRGDTAAARSHLERAMQILERTRDQEDLPGVEIELLRLRAIEDPARADEHANMLGTTVANSNIPIVQIWGSVALAEIAVSNDLDGAPWRKTLDSALALAERAGVPEASWQLNHSIGVLVGRGGDARGRHKLISQALRVLRQIAGGLSPDHRQSYLNAPHVSSALRTMASVHEPG